MIIKFVLKLEIYVGWMYKTFAEEESGVVEKLITRKILYNL